MRTTPVWSGLLVLFVLGAPVAAQELDPPILLLTHDHGASIGEVFRTYGAAEMRTIRMAGIVRRDDLVYRINDREVVIAHFADLKLESVARGTSAAPPPPEANLSDEELVRRGRTVMIRLGWTAEQMAAWLAPDAVIGEASIRRQTPAWAGGDVWVYRTGPYLTHVNMREGRVAEIVDRLLDRARSGARTKMAGK